MGYQIIADTETLQFSQARNETVGNKGRDTEDNEPKLKDTETIISLSEL